MLLSYYLNVFAVSIIFWILIEISVDFNQFYQ